MSVLVGKEAPDFTVPAIMPNNTINEKFNLKEFTKEKVAALFFWPADFTFVCPSEIIAFNNKIEEFKKRDVVLMGCSVDTHFTHFAWKETPINRGGIGNVQFPMLSDLGGDISKAYDVLSEGKVAYRATFLIDQQGKVVHQVVNDLPLGRCVDELIRMIDALLFTQKYGEVCPANWQKGQEGMKATKEGVADYLTKNADKL